MKIPLSAISLGDAQNDADPLFVEPTTTTVVNVKSAAYDVYIGRANAHYGLSASKWANPFRLTNEADRGLVLAKYRMWLLSQSRLLADIHELRGKRLGCYCKRPDREVACHGDFLAELANAPDRPRKGRAAAVWALPSLEAYWREEVRLGSDALSRLYDICQQQGWDYTATLEALR